MSERSHDDPSGGGKAGFFRYRPGEHHAVHLGHLHVEKGWRQGYAFESATAILEYAHASLGLKRVVAVTSPDDAASIGVLEKMGMKFEALVRLEGDTRDVKLSSREAS